MQSGWNRSEEKQVGGLVVANIIVFFAGFCTMLIELVAGQLVSGSIGRSQETWIAVIGVILAGISIGSYIGGKLADRYDTQRLLFWLFLLSAVACVSTLYTREPIGQLTARWAGNVSFDGDGKPNVDWTGIGRILAVVTGVFLLPGTLLGMVSPAVAKWALDKGYATGATVGSIYAVNAIGSIIGTFFTGFYLTVWLDVITIVWLAAGGLLLLSLLFLPSVWSAGESRDPFSYKLANDPQKLLYGESEGIFFPCVLVFVSGFAIMLMEVCASRIVTSQIGSSIYTWTNVIGVILAGIMLGNYLSGRLADLISPPALVGAAFLISSIGVMAILPMQPMILQAQESWLYPIDQVFNSSSGWIGQSAAWGYRVMFVVGLVFFFPSMALGSITPGVVKWALDRNKSTGSTVGTIYAWNTLGSILGTFLTGYLLIPMLFVSKLLALCALVLCLFAWIFLFSSGGWGARLFAIVWTPIALFVALLAFVPADRFTNTVLSFGQPEQSRIRAADVISLKNDTSNIVSAITAFDNALRPTAFAKDFGDANTDYAKAVAAIKQVNDTLQKGDANDLQSLSPQTIAMNFWTAKNSLERFVALMDGKQKDDQSNALKEAADKVIESLHDGLSFSRLARRERVRLFAKLTGRSDEINSQGSSDLLEKASYYDESRYFQVQIDQTEAQSNVAASEEDQENVAMRQLVLDALVHGYINLADFSYLHYEYEHIYARVTERFLRPKYDRKEDLKVLFLGGGSYTFPRYLTIHFPGKADKKVIQCDVAEIDPRVTYANRRALGLNQVNQKRFFLVTDLAQPSLAEVDGNPARLRFLPQAGMLYGATELFRTAFRLKTDDNPQAKHRFDLEREVNMLGGIIVNSLTQSAQPPDYILATTEAPKEVKDFAAARKVPILSIPDFQKLATTTSHENVRTSHMDARQFVIQNQEKGKYQIVYGDAFNDFSVPSHLTTKEFNQKMSELLSDDGVFMANIIDRWRSSRFMGAYINTLKEVFPHVYLFMTDTEEPSLDRSTYVLICAKKALEVDDLAKPSQNQRGLKCRLFKEHEMIPVVQGGLWPIGEEEMNVPTVSDPKQSLTLALSRPAEQVALRAKWSEEVQASQIDAYNNAIRDLGNVEPGSRNGNLRDLINEAEKKAAKADEEQKKTNAPPPKAAEKKVSATPPKEEKKPGTPPPKEAVKEEKKASITPPKDDTPTEEPKKGKSGPSIEGVAPPLEESTSNKVAVKSALPKPAFEIAFDRPPAAGKKVQVTFLSPSFRVMRNGQLSDQWRDTFGAVEHRVRVPAIDDSSTFELTKPDEKVFIKAKVNSEISLLAKPIERQSFGHYRIMIVPSKLVMEFTGDGEQTQFEVPVNDYKLLKEVSLYLDPEAKDGTETIGFFKFDGQTITMKNVIPANARMRAQLFAKKPIVLTDNYSPSDHLLKEVAATRAQDD